MGREGTMKFGLAFASSIAIEHDSALEICRVAEAAGFESVWGGEHVILPTTIESSYPYTADGKIPAEPDTPIPDPLIWLAFAAAAAPTLRLGTCILIVPQRNPLVLAKELATLDRLSGGRVELGLGVGWMREEFDALGVPWERRGARNDEYIAAMRALWAGPHAEFHGEFVDFPPVTCSPRPVQESIPVLVGGDTEAAIAAGGTNRRRLLPRRRRHRPTRRLDDAPEHGGRGGRARSGQHRDQRDVQQSHGGSGGGCEQLSRSASAGSWSPRSSSPAPVASIDSPSSATV